MDTSSRLGCVLQGGYEAMNQLRALAEKMQDIERCYIPTSETRKTAEWWTVSGYRSILQDALARIEKHERRAKRVYGGNAPRFDEVVK